MYPVRPRLSFEPRKYRVVLPKSAPGKVFIIRQLRRFEWMTLQQTNMPRHELERFVLHIGLVSPDVSSLDGLLAGVASVLAYLILRVSYLDDEESPNRMHEWAQSQFESSVDLRLELVAVAVLNGLSFERLWGMTPESWYMHIQAGIHAATLAGVPIAEYVHGGLKGLMEALRRLQSGQGVYPSSAPPQQPGVMEEYAFHWRKGSEPVIRGGVR